MASFVSPGVYTRELDFSAFAARQAGTVVAIVGTAPKGPVNKPILLTAPDRLTENFGTPLETAPSDNNPTANRANFGLHAAYNALNQTNQVWYVRVTDGSERTASGLSDILINNQMILDVDDNDGVTIPGGQMAFTVQVLAKPGAALVSDSFAALVRAFGSRNIFDGNYNPITTLAQLEAALATTSPVGPGAFVNVNVKLANDDVTFENLEQFTSRFNAVMQGQALRAELQVIEDDTTGVTKYITFKTANLSDLISLNLQFLLTFDSGTYASATYANGTVSPVTDDIDFVAKRPGTLGNGISVVFQDVGNTFTGLPPVAVSGSTVTVSINETVTTAGEVVLALDDNSSARNLVTATLATGNDGSSTVAAGTVNLTGGGMNNPAAFSQPAGTFISTTPTQLVASFVDPLDAANNKVLRFNAASPGDYANKAIVEFGKDAFGLQTIEYREASPSTVVEGAVQLDIKPSGYPNSFIDFMPAFQNLGDFAEADYTLLSDDSLGGSLDLCIGTIDVLGAGTIVADTPKEWLAWNAYEFFETVNPVFDGGRSGIPDEPTELVDEIIGNAADKTGLHAFDNRELFDNSLLAAPGFFDSAVIREGLLICEKIGDCLFLADGPGGLVDNPTVLDDGMNAQEIVDWHNGQGHGNSAAFNSSYGALYHGWVRIQDSFNAVEHWVPPSVVVLEQYGFSDNVSELWFAPAGFKRGRLVRALATQERAENNQGDRDYMYSGGNAVNPIVNFPKEGIVLFGQRTLQRNPSALDRVNVRRLLIYAKRVSAATVRPELFEPNDAILWTQLTNLLNPIFAEIKQKRGLNNFLVKIDSSTTTDLNRDNSEVVGYILLEPTKAAEKIILNFVITAQGASFSEALAAAGVA